MADLAPPVLAGAMDIPTGDGHVLHVETYGRAGGRPMVFLHGGPGSGCNASHRAIFDPSRDFVIFPDQRGAGRSTPHGGRTNNTTAHLVADLERVRVQFGLKSWTIVGGSWGATLALAYAAAYPERVSRLVLRAVFLGTRDELEQAFNTQLRALYPQLYEDFAGLMPPSERGTLLDSYWARILSPDPSRHRPAAIAWHDVERILSVAHPPTTRLVPARLSDPTLPMPSSPFMEAHYFAQDCFLAAPPLAARVNVFGHIPATLIHGAADHLCSLAAIAALAHTWPAARLEIVPGAGHAMSEPAILAAVTRAVAAD